MIYELKKLFTKKSSRILLAALILLAAAASVLAAGSVNYTDKDGNLHRGISAARLLTAEKNKWQGELTPQVLSKVISQGQRDQRQAAGKSANPDGENTANTEEGFSSAGSASYADIEFMINQILSGDGDYNPQAAARLTPDKARDLYQTRQQHIEEILRVQAQNPQKQAFLEKKYAAVHTPFYYEAADSWKTLFMYLRIYVLIAVTVIGFFAAGIFADEFRLKADAILFSTRNGRGKAVISKIQAGLFMATAVYWAGALLLSLLTLSAMGKSGMTAPIQIEDPYNIYDITYGQIWLLILLCGYIGALLSASLAMLAAAGTRSHILAASIPLLLFCALPFIGLATAFDTFFSLTPDQLANTYVCIGLPLIYEIGGCVFRQIPFLPVFYGLVSLAALPLIYRVCNRYRMDRKCKLPVKKFTFQGKK